MMLSDIQEAIKANLSGEVGEQLKKELMDLELLRLRIKDYEKAEGEMLRELERLRGMDQQMKHVIDREKDVARKEVELAHAGDLLELKDGHAKDLVCNMRGIVSDVFGNNKFKYQVAETKNIPLKDNEYANIVTDTKVVEGEN